MKFFAIVLLALSPLSVMANDSQTITCKADKYTWLLENGEYKDGYGPQAVEWYEDTELRGTFYTVPWNGMQVAIQILDKPDAAYDISPYKGQLGDIEFEHHSVAVPLKFTSDGSVSVTKKLHWRQVGEKNPQKKSEIVNITLTCRKLKPEHKN